MKKIIAFSLVALSLAGCVTDRQLSDYVCTHRTSVRLSANTALSTAEKIKDPIAKQAAIDAATALLDEVDACPPVVLLR